LSGGGGHFEKKEGTKGGGRKDRAGISTGVRRDKKGGREGSSSIYEPTTGITTVGPSQVVLTSVERDVPRERDGGFSKKSSQGRKTGTRADAGLTREGVWA